MNTWPIGLSTGCFYQTAIHGILAPIRDAGFRRIEICSFPKHLDYHDLKAVERAGGLIREMKLEAYSFHAPFADHIDITALDQARRQTAVEELLRASEAAGILGARYFVIHPGPEMEGAPPPEEKYLRLDHATEVLNQVAAHCRKYSVTLLLENMLPHLLFGHTADTLYLLGAIDDTNVAACLDTGHAFLSGDLPTVIHKLSGHLRMIHANDNHRGWDDHLPPGQGGIPWKAVLEQLRSHNFHGTFILELAGQDGVPPETLLEGAIQARQYLEETARSLSQDTPS